MITDMTSDLSNTRRVVGLTREDAADLIGVSPPRISEAQRADARRGPTRGGYELLLAVWPELGDAARERVRARLAAMRGKGTRP